jgi:hypothetical protein
LHAPAYNLALSGGQPFPMYVALRRALESGARPRAILVDFMWMTVGKPHTYNERLLPEMLTLREAAEYAWAVGDMGFFGQLAVAMHLPSYRARQEIRANIDLALRGQEPYRIPERYLTARNAAANRGAMILAPGKFDGSIDPDQPVMFAKDWSCPPASEHYIERFFALAAEREIPVFWLIPPLPAKSHARLVEIGTKAEFGRLVDRIRSSHPEVVILDGTHAKYDPEAFADPIHMNRAGAAVWSADVAAAVKRRLDSAGTLASRWDHLPDYRPDPQAARLEDLNRTEAILRAALDKLRR